MECNTLLDSCAFGGVRVYTARLHACRSSARERRPSAPSVSALAPAGAARPAWELPGPVSLAGQPVRAPRFGRDQDPLLWRKVEELCSEQLWSRLPSDAV